MISVVVPLYNKEEFITETVRSVLDQTLLDFELIIVNDGSNDDSLVAVEAFSDARINIITIENSGVSIARNTGIKAAKYDWIAFLDSDDWWAPTFLEELVNAAKAYPNYKLFASGRSRVFQGSTERYEHLYLPKDQATAPVNYYRVISKFRPLINSSNVIIRKYLFESVGYFKEGQKKHEDHDLWVRLAVGEEVVFVNKELSFYRKTEKGTASMAQFRANDFCDYLSTMISVKEKITGEELGNFKKYYNRYVVLAYLQHYGEYCKKERKEVFSLIEQLLEGRSLQIARVIKILPLRRAYPMYKKMTGR